MTERAERCKCRECGCESADLYWNNLNGAKLKKPICSQCWERKVLVQPGPVQTAEVIMPGGKQKVSFIDVNGEVVWWEVDE